MSSDKSRSRCSANERWGHVPSQHKRVHDQSPTSHHLPHGRRHSQLTSVDQQDCDRTNNTSKYSRPARVVIRHSHSDDIPCCNSDRSRKRRHSPDTSHSQHKRSRTDSSPSRLPYRHSSHRSRHSSSSANYETLAHVAHRHRHRRSISRHKSPKASYEFVRAGSSSLRVDQADDRRSRRKSSYSRESSEHKSKEIDYRSSKTSIGHRTHKSSSGRLETSTKSSQRSRRKSSYSRKSSEHKSKEIDYRFSKRHRTHKSSSGRLETSTKSSQLPVDEIVPKSSGAVPYAGSHGNIIDGENQDDWVMKELCSCALSGKYYTQGPAQGMQMPTEDLKKLHVTFRKSLLEPAGHFPSAFSFSNIEELPSDKKSSVSSNSTTVTAGCGLNEETTIELLGGEEESEKKEEWTTGPSVSPETTRTQSTVTTHNDRELVNVQRSVIGNKIKSEPHTEQNVNEKNETDYQLPQALTPCTSLYRIVSHNEVDRRGDDEPVPSVHTDTIPPGDAARMIGKEFNLLTNPDSVNDVMDVSIGVDNTHLDEVCSLKLSEAISLPSASLPSKEDSTLVSKPMVAPNLPCNAVNEVTRRTTRGQYLYGQPQPASQHSQWHCYHLSVSPSTNFKCGLTTISTDSGQLFTFRGFSLVTRHSLQEDLPACKFERYGGLYTIELKPIPSPNNFTEEDLILFEEYLFVRLLELYDWVKALKPFCKELMFLPLFVGEREGLQEILPMAEILKFLVDAYQPLQNLKRGAVTCQRSEAGFLVTNCNKRPSCLRVDGLKWSTAAKNQKSTELQFGHYCTALNRTRSHKFDSCKKKKKKYSELINKKNKGKLNRMEHFVLKDLKRTFGDTFKMLLDKSFKPEDLTLISCEGFFTTGLFYDIVQYTTLLSAISHHVLLYDSLMALQQRLGCTFIDPSLLHRAITHPSCTTLTYQLAEDHFKTAALNCGMANTSFITSDEGVNGSRPYKGLKALIESVENGDKGVETHNNEQLEFLGDAVLEYICSIHLYHMYPHYTVGQLNLERQTLVKNKTLSTLASRLDLTSILLTKEKVELSEEGLQHAGANCLEAILGAVFVDKGLDAADHLFAKLAFLEEDKYARWMCEAHHPLIQEYPDGDRHLISESDILKGMIALEECTSVEFKHIRLLAKAFTHSSCSSTELTKGNYQRLEFLGDGILQFLVSKHVYMRFPSHNEGHLSMLRTSLVKNKQLASLCQELGFNKYIITSKTEDIKLTGKLLADVVESYLAALTLDQGLDAAEKFLQDHLFPRLLTSIRGSQLMDSNTLMHQAAAYTCKQQGVTLELPVYKVLPTEGTSSELIFCVAVHFENKKIGTGKASTIKEARKLAAEEALKSSFLRVPPSQKALWKETNQ